MFFDINKEQAAVAAAACGQIVFPLFQETAKELGRQLKWAEEFPLADTMWQHKKTGGVYTLVGSCWIEKTAEIAVLYRGNFDGKIWCRPAQEFFDGRFVRYEPPVATETLYI